VRVQAPKIQKVTLLGGFRRGSGHGVGGGGLESTLAFILSCANRGAYRGSADANASCELPFT